MMTENYNSQDLTLNLLFGAAPALIDVLDQAQTSIHAAMYGITNTRIVDALLAAKERGVDVALKTDKIESAGV